MVPPPNLLEAEGAAAAGPVVGGDDGAVADVLVFGVAALVAVACMGWVVPIPRPYLLVLPWD